MNNWGIYKAIVDFFGTATGAEKAILIFILLNIAVTLFNSWVQFKLKSKDQKNISFKMKEEKKIVIYEMMFDKMQKLNYLNVSQDQDAYLKQITDLEKYKEINRLYVCTKASKCVTGFCDYCKIVLTDYRKKDLRKEDKFVNAFKKIYNN